MFDIEMQETSEEFARCWQAAGRHIQKQVQGPLHSWLKATLNPPFLEHISFRLGNQLFFIRLETEDEELEVPGIRDGLLMIAKSCKGHPCLMPMRRLAETWRPIGSGWGMVDARSGLAIDPVALVTDELIEMTDWELQDFAVQIVRDHLEKEGRELMSWQGNPDVDPSIWFVGENGPEWVVVRALRYPETDARRPQHWDEIAASCVGLGKTGHFASVSVANADDSFEATVDAPALPLWRGHALLARFEGLVPDAVQ